MRTQSYADQLVLRHHNVANCAVNMEDLTSNNSVPSVRNTGVLIAESSFFLLQGKTPKEIHVILTETLACFLPGGAKDLSAPL